MHLLVANESPSTYVSLFPMTGVLFFLTFDWLFTCFTTHQLDDCEAMN